MSELEEKIKQDEEQLMADKAMLEAAQTPEAVQAPESPAEVVVCPVLSGIPKQLADYADAMEAMANKTQSPEDHARAIAARANCVN